MTDWTERTDRELVEACGDLADERFDSAFEALYLRYRDRAYSIAFRMTGTTNDAMDVVQDAFRVVFQRISSFRFEARFTTWLYRIVVNCSIDHRRREAAGAARRGVSLASLDHRFEPAAEDDGPRVAAETVELGDHVHASLQRLSPKLRAVLVLRYLEGLTYEELAEALQISLGTVKSRVARAHAALERVLRGTLGRFGLSEEGVA